MSNYYMVGSDRTATEWDSHASAKYFAQSQIAARTRHRLNPALRLEVEQAKRSLENISELKDDWDGYGASTISKSVRICAWQALRHFEAGGAIPEISPSTNGTVIFDWQSNGVRARFEVGEHNYSMFVTGVDGKTEFFDGSSRDVSGAARRALGEALADSTGDDSSVNRGVVPIHFAAARIG